MLVRRRTTILSVRLQLWFTPSLLSGPKETCNQSDNRHELHEDEGARVIWIDGGRVLVWKSRVGRGSQKKFQSLGCSEKD
ncbi:uncharacterized protein B0T23DRAFT_90039 [Neurospora hispaniola]|uniref:Secreted protein n=1 Tax=Neurospora hispaniola TaxID=588809 RepID=A0AAJ0IDC0_9PEZI|nr:hypothetical protein B0T23DRAFT_90039 [Neurospora hispaniola]